jgi:hypothetical protein
VQVPYHLPLPARYRRRDGDYPLASESRFYSKMDFAHRPKQYRVLNTTVTIMEVARGGFDLAFDLNGQDTSLTIELCFRPGGTLTGVVPATGDGNFQLVEGDAPTPFPDDRLGPGNGRGAPNRTHGGRRSTYLGGSLVPSVSSITIGHRSDTRCGCDEPLHPVTLPGSSPPC